MSSLSSTSPSPSSASSTDAADAPAPRVFAPKPPWLKVRAPGGDTYHNLKKTFRELDLHTVCEEARCPNVGECWREGTATVMLLGDVCTRGCRFCAVTTGDPRGAVDVREPEHVARAIARLGLTYVVMTMVNRDDLLDGGAEHVARTVRRLRQLRPDILIETLVGDFQGHMSAVDIAIDSAPDVFAHNVEVVRRLTRSVRDVRSSYDQSLAVLRRAHVAGREKMRASELDSAALREPRAALRIITKSSIMVGLGETTAEIEETLRDLRDAGVDVVTIGQYLRPTPKHHPVVRFVEPDEFAAFQRLAIELGFLYAASGPLVRSSYKAAEVFLHGVLRGEEAGQVHAALDERLERARAGAARVSAELGEPTAEARVEEAALRPGDLSGAGATTTRDSMPLIPLSSLVRR